MKLQLKILLPIILLIVLLLALSSYVTYKISSDSLRFAISSNMADEAHNMRRTVNTVMQDSIGDMVRTAGNEVVVDYVRGGMGDEARGLAMTAPLTRLSESYDQFDRITILNEKGIVVASSAQNTIKTDFSARAHFKAGMKGETHITRPIKVPLPAKAL